MRFLQGVARVWKWVRQPAPPRVPGPHVLPAYVAMGRYVAGTAQLEPRLRLLVTQLAAERAECGWCIEQGRHLWRQAFLAPELLRALPTYGASPLFSAKERAALAFADAVTRYADAAGGVPPAALAELRRHFTEPEIAALARAVALEHFFNPVTGALGADAAVSGAAPVRARPLPRAPGTAIRNLW